MFELISFLIALIGSSLAAIYDLKITPTEIPDEIPYAMIGLALILACVQSFIELNFGILVESLLYGLFLLTFGYLMYKFGQWGGGDAKVLAAIGFLSPGLSSFIRTQSPFVLSYLINLFLLGAIYMLLYALVLAIANRKIISGFLKSVKSSSNVILISSPVLFFFFLFGNWYLFNLFGLTTDLYSLLSNSLILLLATAVLFLVWKFVKAVEEIAFKKKVKVSELKVGDVLLESKIWEGITAKELRNIKRSGKKFVVIKEGVRFAPAFPLALLFTLFFSDSILFVVRFLF
jgi:Flp pilus assembly protein protease CpaA